MYWPRLDQQTLKIIYLHWTFIHAGSLLVERCIVQGTQISRKLPPILLNSAWFLWLPWTHSEPQQKAKISWTIIIRWQRKIIVSILKCARCLQSCHYVSVEKMEATAATTYCLNVPVVMQIIWKTYNIHTLRWTWHNAKLFWKHNSV